MSADRKRLDKLIHDVNSKCTSLRSAAALLPAAAAGDRREILELMTQQSAALASLLAAFSRDPDE